MTTTSLLFGPKALAPIFVFFLQFDTTPVRGAVAVSFQQSHRRIPAALFPSRVVIPDATFLILDVKLAPSLMKVLKEKRHLMKIVTIFDGLLIRGGQRFKLFRVGYFLSAHRRSSEFFFPLRIRTCIALLRSFAESLLRFQVMPVADRIINAEEVISGQGLEFQWTKGGPVKALVISLCGNRTEQHKGGDNGNG